MLGKRIEILQAAFNQIMHVHVQATPWCFEQIEVYPARPTCTKHAEVD